MVKESGGHSSNCLPIGLGIVAGLVLGVVLALTLGDAIGQALAISNFEGARGYFIVFVLAPALAIVGAAIGGIGVSIWTRRGRTANTRP